MRNAARVLVLAMLASSAFSPAAQKKDDLLSIQRDIATLVESVAALQKSQDAKMQAITVLVQQSMAASAQVSGSLAALQTSLTNSLNQSLAKQQKKMAEQHTEMGTRVDAISSNVGALGETMTQLSARLKEMNAKLENLNELVKTLNAPPAIPVPVPTPTANSANGAPPTWSATAAWSNARLDYGSGRYSMALDEFIEYVKFAPKDDENAPNAQHYIGLIYDQNGQFDDAAKAFGDVVDRFAKNPKTCESSYMKGVELQKGKHNEEATSALYAFLAACPGDVNRENANTRIHQMNPAPRNNTKGSKGKK